MQHISVSSLALLIVILFSVITCSIASSENPLMEAQTIEVIRECMAQTPAPWSEEWKKEYLENIRRAIELRANIGVKY